MSSSRSCTKRAPFIDSIAARIGEEQVAEARKKIAAGASLRSAAAEIPCAPSTLSDRIKQAEEVALKALGRAGIDNRRGHPKKRARSNTWADDDTLGPVEVLVGALSATRANGQPDWPTRVTAARALAQLRPELVEPTQHERPPLIVYDLPPGAPPTLHRAQPLKRVEPSHVPPSVNELPLPSGVYLFTDSERTFQLAEVERDPEADTYTLHIVDDRDEARDVFAAVGGNLSQLEALLTNTEALPDLKTPAGTTPTKEN